MKTLRQTKIILGEIIFLIASVFVFRSLWTLLDEYLGKSYLTELLIAGMVLTPVGLALMYNELKNK
jgi:hypothetical protein